MTMTGKPRMYPFKTRTLERTQRLQTIGREGHARGKVYLVHDRQHKRVLVLCQRLALAVDYLNMHAVTDPEDRLSYASLYEIVGKRGGRVDGWHKRRWRVEPLPIEDATVTRFEAVRAEHEQAVVLGQMEHYLTDGSPTQALPEKTAR